MSLYADGSSTADAPDPVVIDAGDPADRWRFTCPNGHAGTNIQPINGGYYCHGCARHTDIGQTTYYEIEDTKTGRAIPWHRVEIRR